MIGNCEDPLTLSPELAWLTFEKFWNDGSPSGFHVVLPAPYSPNSDPGVFQLPLTLRSWDDVTRIGSYPSTFPPMLPQGEYFPIHPIEVGRHSDVKEIDHTVMCTATASGRTLAVLNQEGTGLDGFIKMSMERRLGRYSRRIELYKWLSSIAVNCELQASLPSMPVGVHFLMKYGGLYSTTLDRGVHFRSSKVSPTPKCDELSYWIVPAFALISKRGRKYSLLGRLCPQINCSVAISHIVYPLLDGYFALALERGLIFESHAQNVLFLINRLEGAEHWGIVFRDFSDVFIDLPMRRLHGLSVDFPRYKLLGDECGEDDTFKRRSFAFDFKLGEYLLNPLLGVLVADYGLDIQVLKSAVVDRVSMWVERYPGYFGSTKGYFCYRNSGNVGRFEYSYVDKAPLFRK